MSILRLFLLPPTVPQKCVNAGLRIFLALQSSIWFSSLKTFIICHNSKTQPNLKCGIVPPKLYLYIDNDNNNKQQIKCHPLGMFTDGGKGVSSQTPPGEKFFLWFGWTDAWNFPVSDILYLFDYYLLLQLPNFPAVIMTISFDLLVSDVWKGLVNYVRSIQRPFWLFRAAPFTKKSQ